MAEYDIGAKGAEFLEAFVDPGPPFDPAEGPPDVWFRRVVDHLPDVVIAFQHDGTVTYVSDAATFLLGHEPAALLGTNALDLLHPDDLEVAAETVYHAAEIEGWRPPRPFRLRHADGSYATFDIAGLALFHVPEVRSIVCVARWADDVARVNAVVGHLAARAPIDALVAEIVHLMHRPGWRIGVAALYDGDDGHRQIAHTGLPAALTDLDPAAPGTPWSEAAATGRPVHDVGLTRVDPELAATAAAAGYRTLSAVPVPDPGHDDAVVLVWNWELLEPELGQQILLDRLVDLLGLALAGRSRAEALERAALTDPLTGLANRRGFEDALAQRTPGPVALLLLDLDAFKAVNDVHGHPAGDEVIRVVAARIGEHIRRDDLAARIGGDEFAVLCPGLGDPAVAERLAGDLIDAITRPIPIPTRAGGAGAEGTDVDVAVGVSIGIAIAVAGPEGTDPERLLHAADQRLYEAKAAGKGAHRTGIV